MKCVLAAPALVLGLSGCLAPMTDRMDLMNRQLSTVTAEIAETNQRLASMQAKLDEANSRLDVVDQTIMKFPALRPAPGAATPPPVMRVAPTAPAPGPGGL